LGDPPDSTRFSQKYFFFISLEYIFLFLFSVDLRKNTAKIVWQTLVFVNLEDCLAFTLFLLHPQD